VELADEKLTAAPEDAVALTLNAGLPNTLFARVPKVIVWTAGVTWKLWLTGVAAAKLVLPACVAWMLHVPALTSVTVDVDTVQTGDVVEVKVTVRPEDAVALTGNGAVPNAWSESVPKVMVWVAGATLKVWSTGVAAL
jgi:hypothetical protein